MKKGSLKTLLFDSVPIEIYIFSLLHAVLRIVNLSSNFNLYSIASTLGHKFPWSYFFI